MLLLRKRRWSYNALLTAKFKKKYAVIFSVLNKISLRAYHRPKVGYGTNVDLISAIM